MPRNRFEHSHLSLNATVRIASDFLLVDSMNCALRIFTRAEVDELTRLLIMLIEGADYPLGRTPLQPELLEPVELKLTYFPEPRLRAAATTSCRKACRSSRIRFTALGDADVSSYFADQRIISNKTGARSNPFSVR